MKPRTVPPLPVPSWSEMSRPPIWHDECLFMQQTEQPALWQKLQCHWNDRPEEVAGTEKRKLNHNDL